MINVQFETNNAAFEDDKWAEVGRILGYLSSDASVGGITSDKFPIFDINGNRIGLIWESE